MRTRTLHQLLENSARLHPGQVAVEDPDNGSVTYKDLVRQTQHIGDALLGAGVGGGDRVGIYAAKSIGSVASIFAVLKAGACYVPVDPDAPPARNVGIFRDCAAKAIIVERRLLKGLEATFGNDALTVTDELQMPDLAATDLVLVTTRLTISKQECDTPPEEGLAYILYTSGSTGKPKGVMHSHSTALSFVDWCSEEFSPDERDRFSSHAPFHFDLSILDLYLAIKHGATIVLIGETLGKQPLRLAPLIAERRISVWYSTPSILRLLVEYGKMQSHDYSALRLVFFAGEVFPPKFLLELKAIWQKPRYYNLYGPTETNVCTFFEVPGNLPADHTKAFPIGKPCSGDRTMVMNEHHREVTSSEDGELYVSGGSIMLGYWNLPEQNARVFFSDNSGTLWYRTGDIVRDDGDENYTFIGRRDRMVKRRGFRVELGEIESVLYQHSDIAEAAVIALADEEGGVQIKAYLAWSGHSSPSQIELKRFSAENLPMYMVPDRFSILPALPRTSTDKIDYQQLKGLD